MIAGKHRKELIALRDGWDRAARGYFRSADLEEEAFARRFVTHGGIIHANHTAALTRVLERPGWRERVRKFLRGRKVRHSKVHGTEENTVVTVTGLRYADEHDPGENAVITASDLLFSIEHDPESGITALMIINGAGRLEMDRDWLDLLIKQLTVCKLSQGGAP